MLLERYARRRIKRHVLDPCIPDSVQHARVLTYASHASAERAVAPQVLHIDIAGVGSVVADVNLGVGDGDALDVQSVVSFSNGQQ